MYGLDAGEQQRVPSILPPTTPWGEAGVRKSLAPKFCTTNLHWLETGKDRCVCGLLKADLLPSPLSNPDLGVPS